MADREHSISPAPSPEEAAAVVAAIERFLADHRPVVVAATEQQDPWLRAALMEGTGREPDAASPWGDPVPWS